MENLYLISTTDKITISQKINELKEKNKDAELVEYDLQEVSVDRIIEDLDTYNFLASKKIVVGYNAFFLSSDKNKSSVPHDLDKLQKYIENPNVDNILILVTDEVDKRKKITSLLFKSAIVIEKTSDIHSLIKKSLEDYKMDFKTEKLLLEYCQNDNERVFNEIEKLKLLKMDSKEITEEDIKEIVMKNLDDNIFHLVDSILNGDKKYAFMLYQNFLLHGEQITTIIRILANKIRLIYQVKILLKDGNSDQKISKLLGVHEYPVKLAREKGYSYNENKLLSYLEKLTNLDYEIKSGQTKGQVEFEMLLAEI